MKIHFTGIGGAGMAPLARIALERGCEVSGSDREAGAKCESLRRSGARISIGHEAANLPPELDLLVHTSAVAADNPELAEAAGRGVPVLRRGAYLAELLGEYRRPVAVSGSHGKTSITAMIAWILYRTVPGAGWMIGGEVTGFPAARAGTGDLFVTEVDESDGTHALAHPWCGVVPNIDDDHSWSVGGEEQLQRNFRRFGENCRHLVYIEGEWTERLYRDLPQAEAVRPDLAGVPANLAGFQRSNGALALAVAEKLGIGPEPAREALAAFPGVERRLSLRGRIGATDLVEDYAHHPAELAQSLATLREMFPGRRLAVVFQPHRYARLEKYFDRLAAELRRADEVVVVPVFAAWCDRGPVDAADLARAAQARYLEGSWEEVARGLGCGEDKVLAVIGAGDVNRIFDYLRD